MRRGLSGFALIALAFFATTCVLAADAPPRPTGPADPPSSSGAVTAVTDAAGNPVSPASVAAAPRHGVEPESEKGRAEVQRGRAWWPYATALPPYTAVDKRAEAMTEDEILVNGVAALDVRNPEAAHSRDAQGPPARARQPARAGGRLLPRQDQGNHSDSERGRRPRGGRRGTRRVPQHQHVRRPDPLRFHRVRETASVRELRRGLPAGLQDQPPHRPREHSLGRGLRRGDRSGEAVGLRCHPSQGSGSQCGSGRAEPARAHPEERGIAFQRGADGPVRRRLARPDLVPREDPRGEEARREDLPAPHGVLDLAGEPFR